MRSPDALFAEKQRSDPSHMLFKVDELIEDISQGIMASVAISVFRVSKGQ